MIPDQKVDANIRAFLQVFSENIDIDDRREKTRRMRAAMRRIMLESYTQGTQDTLVASGRLKP